MLLLLLLHPLLCGHVASGPCAAFPEPGWVEQDPLAMLASVTTCIEEAVARLQEQGTFRPTDIKGALAARAAPMPILAPPIPLRLCGTQPLASPTSASPP
jgi:hypothetical protein